MLVIIRPITTFFLAVGLAIFLANDLQWISWNHMVDTFNDSHAFVMAIGIMTAGIIELSIKIYRNRRPKWAPEQKFSKMSNNLDTIGRKLMDDELRRKRRLI